ncbi:MAG: hypothetical protein UU82_C0019G0003 [Candidatus Nomurabacteria bacterium GW2011_GWC2_41_8]|nr:MAG: hypothetical protein UU82_C0019G0003 [Candidatus Nomurabacteria bacterium GW2011_GWC2_41_8]
MQLDPEDSAISHLKISGASSIINNTSFRDGVLAVNELSAGLSVGLANSDFLTSYKSVVGTQIEALNHSLVLGESLRLGTAKMESFIETSIAPLSSVIAGVGLATLNANKLYETGTIVESAFTSAQKISDLCLDVVQRQQHVLSATIDRIQNSGIFQRVSDSIMSTQVISSGVNNVLRSLPTYPTTINLPNLEKIYEVGELTDEEISEHQKKLDKMLLKIDPSLVEFRKGCWETFRRKGKDYIRQSSSSMRGLVDALLHILAPTEKVKETEFFKKSPEAKDNKGNPNRKARVYHIVKFDHKKADHLKRLTRGFLEAYDNLSAWDHIPLQQDAFVQGVFVIIEGCLFSILSQTDQ